MVQWLRLHVPNAWGPGLIPGQGTRSCVLQLRPRAAKLKKKKSLSHEVSKRRGHVLQGQTGSTRVSQAAEGMRENHGQESSGGFHREAGLGWANMDNSSGSEAIGLSLLAWHLVLG